MNDRIWIGDLSKHNYYTDLQWKAFIDNGLGGVVIKAGGAGVDPKLDTHVKTVKRLGIGFGLYHWSDPTVAMQPQIDRLKAQIDTYGPLFIACDFEHYWRSWAQWEEVMVKKTPGVKLEIFSSSTLDRYYDKHASAFRKLGDEYNLPTVGYTANWFVKGYCNTVGYRISQYLDWNWLPAYPTWADPNSDKVCTWNEFHSFLNSLDWDWPTLPAGIERMDIWQFNDHLPFSQSPTIDVNWISNPAFDCLFKGIKPVVQEEETEGEVIHSSNGKLYWEAQCAMNIRSEPLVMKSTDIGDIRKGELLEQEDVVGNDAWLVTRGGKYVAIKKGSKRYLELRGEEQR